MIDRARCEQLTDDSRRCLLLAGHPDDHKPTPTLAEVLAFEGRPFTSRQAKENAISTELRLAPIRYYQLLNQAIDTVEALEVNPILVNRLQRQRQQSTR